MPTKSPFYDFRNTILHFEVETTGEDVLDVSGNPQPSKVTLKVEAFMKPVKSKARSGHYQDYPDLGISEQMLEGYAVTPFKFPASIKILDKTIYAKYRDQEGEFTRLIRLQSSVEADKLTGYPLFGVFKVKGG